MLSYIGVSSANRKRRRVLRRLVLFQLVTLCQSRPNLTTAPDRFGLGLTRVLMIFCCRPFKELPEPELDVEGVQGRCEVEALNTTLCPTIYRMKIKANSEIYLLWRGTMRVIMAWCGALEMTLTNNITVKVLAKAWYAAHFPFPVLHPCPTRESPSCATKLFSAACSHVVFTGIAFAPPHFHRHTQALERAILLSALENMPANHRCKRR